MSRKKKKVTKKKKFFIILACYLSVFIITSLVTLTTMAWFNSSTWQSETLYMGGPVYIYFSSDDENQITSGEGALITELPDNWEKLYPGMNMKFQARAVVQGHTFEQTDDNGDQFIQYTTTAVLRARIILEVITPDTIVDPDGNIQESSAVSRELYNFLWPQLRDKALSDTSNPGVWVFDILDPTTEENNYFYYVARDQEEPTTDTLKLVEVGGKDINESVGFLNNAVIQLPAIETDNRHADCVIRFKIVFQAVQAFFPYQRDEIGQPYQGDTTGRSEFVTADDVGLEKPLNIANSRRIFNEAAFTPENGWTVIETN